jgi:hypothetical protein
LVFKTKKKLRYHMTSKHYWIAHRSRQHQILF